MLNELRGLRREIGLSPWSIAPYPGVAGPKSGERIPERNDVRLFHAVMASEVFPKRLICFSPSLADKNRLPYFLHLDLLVEGGI